MKGNLVGVQIHIPGTLRRFTDGSKTISVDAGTVGDALRALAARFPLLDEHLFAADGDVRNFMNVYLNSQDVRYLQRMNTAVRPGDVVALLPAISGG